MMEFLNNACETDRNERAWRFWKATHPTFGGEDIKPCNVCGLHFSKSFARALFRPAHYRSNGETCTCELPLSPEPRPQEPASDTAVAMDHVSASRSASEAADAGSGTGIA